MNQQSLHGLFMAQSAHDGAAFTAPPDVVFMTSDALFVKGRQQGHRNFTVELFLVAPGAFAALAVIVIGKNVEIVMTDAAAEFIFVEEVIELYRVLVKFAKLPALQVHKTGLCFFPL